MPHIFGTIVLIDEAIASFFSYVCNIILLYCVLKNWKPELRRLNIMLIQNIVLDLVLGFFPGVSGMWMSFIDGRVYVLMTGLVRFTNYKVGCLLYCLYCAVLCLCIFAFPMQFFVRYRTLCRNDIISHRLHASLYIVLLVLSLVIFTGFFLAYSFHHDLERNDFIASVILTDYVGFDANTPYVVADVRFDKQLWLPVTFGFILICFTLSSIITIYYAGRITQFIFANAAMTARFKHTYMMLHRTLMVQATLFFISGVVPIIIMAIYSVLRVRQALVIFAVASSVFAWVSAINPCVSIYMILPFRRFLKSKFTSNVAASSKSQALQPVSTQTPSGQDKLWLLINKYRLLKVFTRHA